MARGFAARFYLIPLQVNSGVDMTGQLSSKIGTARACGSIDG